MSVFVVLSSVPDAALKSRISSHFQGHHHALGESAWFVSADMSVQRLSETLGLSPGSSNVVVATLAGPYWGIATASTWEWLKGQFERSSHGQR